MAEERDVLGSHPAGPQRFDPAQDGAGRVVGRGGKFGDRDCARILIEAYEIRERASGIDRYPVLPQRRSPVVSAGAPGLASELPCILLVLSLTRKGRELHDGRSVKHVLPKGS
jgi:hypothetical protein